MSEGRNNISQTRRQAIRLYLAHCEDNRTRARNQANDVLEPDSRLLPGALEKAQYECDFAFCDYVRRLTGHLRNDRDLKSDFEMCEKLAQSLQSERHASVGNTLFTASCGRWLRPGGLALAVSAVLVGMLCILKAALMKAQPTVYQTFVGERRMVVLSDSSKVILNTNTLLSVDYNKRTRYLNISRGEALFEVKPDKAVPFEVEAGNGVVTAVGTEFSVFVEGSEVMVSVLEGVVSIERTVDSGKNVTRLREGESLTYWDNGAVGDIGAADTKRIEAWRTGKAVFRTLRLADAVAEHNRHSHTRIVIGDNVIKDLMISGAFKMGDTQSLIFLLENAMELSAQRQADMIVLTGSRSALAAETSENSSL